ncbi:MAG: hypothetical protein L6Q54_06320 [Leptospiraceae bacterium]|nr:hypothetical protein [Leptospiraceae bacterium]MCK6380851.1 hypothetical protein [Leptospiraceae bacterium]
MEPNPLYSQIELGAGKQPQEYPNQYSETGVSGETIPFGKAVGEGSGGKTRLALKSLAIPFKGVANFSTDAKDPDNNSYLDGDPMGITKTGFIQVKVEEAVTPLSTVRIRVEDHASDVTKTHGNFCTTAEAGKTAKLKGAEFKSTLTSAGVATLFLPDSVEYIAD